jgi:membrane protein implicated in regulation of membrane protease activity
MEKPVETPRRRQINWLSVLTVMSAAILIGAEVFGAAFAGGWALAGLFHLGDYGGYALQSVFFLIGLAIMASFIRAARKVEPFTRS